MRVLQDPADAVGAWAPGLFPRIPTALTWAESAALESLARERRVLELGAQYGYSTVLMGRVADAVVSIDWHKGDPHIGAVSTLEPYLANLALLGPRRWRVQEIVGRFELVVPTLPVLFDMAFLDGAHDFDNVVRDLRLVVPKLEAWGVIACHDYGRFEVQPAILWWLDQPEAEGWRILSRADTLVVLTRG